MFFFPAQIKTPCLYLTWGKSPEFCLLSEQQWHLCQTRVTFWDFTADCRKIISAWVPCSDTWQQGALLSTQLENQTVQMSCGAENFKPACHWYNRQLCKAVIFSRVTVSHYTVIRISARLSVLTLLIISSIYWQCWSYQFQPSVCVLGGWVCACVYGCAHATGATTAQHVPESERWQRVTELTLHAVTNAQLGTKKKNITHLEVHYWFRHLLWALRVER